MKFSHHIGCGLGLIALISAAPALAASPEPSRPPANGAQLEQKVDRNEVSVGNKTVISAGHVDLGPKLVAGKWKIQIRDDSASPAVWRPLDSVVLKIPDQAQLPVPTGAEYEFLNAKPGSKLYVIPQTQNSAVPWLGWNTQDAGALQTMGRGTTLSLVSSAGPGDFSLFLQEGSFGKPKPLWEGRSKQAQNVWVEANTHTHANWVFSRPGAYLLTIAASASLPNGKKIVDTGNLRFAIGSSTSPESAWALAGPQPEAAKISTTSVPPAEQQGSQLPWRALAGVAGGAGLAAVVFTFRARSQQRRRRAAAGVGSR